MGGRNPMHPRCNPMHTGRNPMHSGCNLMHPGHNPTTLQPYILCARACSQISAPAVRMLSDAPKPLKG